MACYSPLQAFVGKPAVDGKLSIVWTRGESWRGEELQLPCGQCVGCRLERSRQWAIRCMHEASLHKENCFITLTYDDYHYDQLSEGSLAVDEFQRFMKRLRKEYGPGVKAEFEKGLRTSPSIRYYHCGEYGEEFGRPHYHACLFNFNFPDRVLWSRRVGGPVYKSVSLDRIWGNGITEIGEVNFESAAYVARYVMKKINGEERHAHYGTKSPEYSTMSRRPGIGSGWYDLFKKDVYPSDSVVVRGREIRPPQFYDRKIEVDNPDVFKVIKQKRKATARRHASDNTPERLKVKEVIKLEQLKNLKRPLEGSK